MDPRLMPPYLIYDRFSAVRIVKQFNELMGFLENQHEMTTATQTSNFSSQFSNGHIEPSSTPPPTVPRAQQASATNDTNIISVYGGFIVGRFENEPAVDYGTYGDESDDEETEQQDE